MGDKLVNITFMTDDTMFAGRYWIHVPRIGEHVVFVIDGKSRKFEVEEVIHFAGDIGKDLENVNIGLKETTHSPEDE